jgi:carbamoyl-phosphate synthase/aspartate carbamoyltransferase
VSDIVAPSSPSSGGAVAYNATRDLQPFPAVPTPGNGSLILPATSPIVGKTEKQVVLELEDGTVYQGYSFGAEKSVAGELVFQTGMVGYPESITDPSYRGQILVITFPLVGNYGVPSRETVDEILKDLPKHFESTQIHIAALVVASYSGEDYSHYLAQSSLGQWLKEQDVPAMYGVDTRSLTKRIREEGSMLGRIMLQASAIPNGTEASGHPATPNTQWRSHYEQIDWVDPNKKNLVQEGKPSTEEYTTSGWRVLTGTYLQCRSESLVSIRLPKRSPSSIHPVARCEFSAWMSV